MGVRARAPWGCRRPPQTRALSFLVMMWVRGIKFSREFAGPQRICGARTPPWRWGTVGKTAWGVCAAGEPGGTSEGRRGAVGPQDKGSPFRLTTVNSTL